VGEEWSVGCVRLQTKRCRRRAGERRQTYCKSRRRRRRWSPVSFGATNGRQLRHHTQGIGVHVAHRIQGACFGHVIRVGFDLNFELDEFRSHDERWRWSYGEPVWAGRGAGVAIKPHACGARMRWIAGLLDCMCYLPHPSLVSSTRSTHANLQHIHHASIPLRDHEHP
jgi:hypothetical protein